MFEISLSSLQVQLLLATTFYLVMTAPVVYTRLAPVSKKQ